MGDEICLDACSQDTACAWPECLISEEKARQILGDDEVDHIIKGYN